jgi:hypothetical protein
MFNKRASVSDIPKVPTQSRRSKTEEAPTVEIVFPWAEEHEIALEELDSGKYIVKNVQDFKSMEKIMDEFSGWWQTKADFSELDSPIALTRAQSQISSVEYEKIKQERRSIAQLDNINNFLQIIDSLAEPIFPKNKHKSEIVEPVGSLPKKIVPILTKTPKSETASGSDPKSASNGTDDSPESLNPTPTILLTEPKLQQDRGSNFRTQTRTFISQETAKLEALILENSSDQKFPSFLEIESNISRIQGKFNSRDQFTGLGKKYSKSKKLIYQGFF